MRSNTRRPLARFLAIMLFAAGVFALATPPAQAQPSEAQTEEILTQANNAASIAEQLAMQGGQIAGRTGSRLASASGSMVTILTNFDVLACGTSVMALSVQMRNITMAAATAQPPNPQLDQLASRLREAVAQLQGLCNRYVHGVATGAGAGAAGGDGTGSAVAGGSDADSGQTLNADERICSRRCAPAYSAFLDAQRDYERALREAQRARQDATAKRQTATQKAAEASQAERDAEQTATDYERLQRELTAATSQSERLRIAEAISRTNPDRARRFAEGKRSEANQAEQEAANAESAATRAEGRASAKYVVMRELYNAWKTCAENCADQARRYSRVDVDIWSLFSLAPRTLPSPPPFYRPPAPPARQATTPDTRTSRLVLPPAALTGGMLAGVVIDRQDEPQENTQVAIEMPGGEIAEATTDASGGFAISMPAAIGQVALRLLGGGAEAESVALEVMDGVPAGLPATPGEFVQAGSPMILGEPYRAISIGQPGGVPGEVPVGTAIGADGESGMTALTIPAWVQPGPVEIGLIGADGEQVIIESQAYTFLEAWLERDKLTSGESAQFGYQLDFGDGPGQVVMIVTVTGAVTYAKAGQPQVLQLDEQGRVTFTDTINALEGTPAGAPFAIIPAFSRGN